MTSKIPSSSTSVDVMRASVHVNWSQSLEASVSQILLSSAHLSTGASSALDRGKDVALVCSKPTFSFRRQEMHRGQNQRMDNHVPQRVSWKEVLSHSQG